MSLIIAMKASSGIVLAADSRGTIGDPRGLTAINDSHMKIYRYGRFGIGIAGASELGNVLLDELNKRMPADSVGIDDAVLYISKECSTMFRNWFQDTPVPNRPGVIFSIAGHRKLPDGSFEPMIYMLSSQLNFAPQLMGDNPCLTGVPQYAVYLMHRYYTPGISLDKAKALTAYLISETASQDPKVGGPIKMATITSEKGYEEVDQAGVTILIEANQKLNEQLREFFLTKGG